MIRADFFKKLEKGQVHFAVIEEVISFSEAICSFRGDLLRINNFTDIEMKKGNVIKLQVKSLEPLQFQVFDSRLQKFERVI